MDEKALFFFRQDPQALPLYEEFERLVLSEMEQAAVKARKTQISFYNRHMFACVSFAKVGKAERRPKHYIVITFGLGRRVDSPRIAGAVEPYPNRWTHHVLVSDVSQLDEELMGWVREAGAFAAGK